LTSTVEVSGQKVIWKLERDPRLKKVHIQVNPQEGVIVRAPVNLKTSAITDVLKGQGSWLLETITKMAAICPRREYQDGEAIPYLGMEKRLRFLEARGRVKARLVADGIELYLKQGGRDTVRECLALLYKREAARWFPERVAKLNEHYFGHDIGRVTVKSQSRILGSCSNRGNLNFNWRLLLAPIEIVDYVIIHELAHLEELNHSSRFWKVVEGACPEYRQRLAWLKEMGGTLYI